jgi:hypothetical protein
MNQAFPSEVSDSSSRRSSLRQKAPQIIPKKFFKKVYRKKTHPERNQHLSEDSKSGDPAEPQQYSLISVAGMIYPPVNSNSRQYKAILAHRVKKLKRRLAQLRQEGMSNSILSGGPTGEGNVLVRSFQGVKTKRSLHAQIRPRDSRGKFLNGERTKCDSQQETTVDLRERGSSDIHRGSFNTCNLDKVEMESILGSRPCEPFRLPELKKQFDTMVNSYPVTDDVGCNLDEMLNLIKDMNPMRLALRNIAYFEKSPVEELLPVNAFNNPGLTWEKECEGNSEMDYQDFVYESHPLENLLEHCGDDDQMGFDDLTCSKPG